MTDRRPSAAARGWLPGASTRARGLVLAAGLMPMLAWPMSAGRLVRPLEAMAWLAVFAVLMAAAPGRALRTMAYAQCLLLPLTLSWIGTVASTGTGPSVAGLESLSAGACREVVDALGVALLTRGFQIVASLTVLATLGGAWLARRCPCRAAAGRGCCFC